MRTRLLLFMVIVVSLALENTAVLYAAYMSFLRSGGLFIPTSRMHELGEEVYLLISLMDAKEKLEVRGDVIWVMPKGNQGNRAQGIGVRFKDDAGKILQDKIECLIRQLSLEKPTHTC